MSRLYKMVGAVIVLALAYALLAEFEPNGWDSQLRVLDWPVVSIRQGGAQGWLSLGQGASGVLVIAQAGAGVVVIAQVGVGLVFGIGQLMAGLVVLLGQLGLGLLYFTGQVGFGLQARGQGVLVRKSKEYFDALSEELSEALF